MYHIFYMKCTALLVFSGVFTVLSLQKHEFLVHFTWIYQNTHVPYIPHEMHCFASVFMCFHCVFTAETCTFSTYHIYLLKYTCTIYSTCTVLLVFSCVFTVISLKKHELLVHFTWIYQNTHVQYLLHEKHIFCYCFHVFSLCFHCKNIYFWYISHLYQKRHVPYILHKMHSFAIVFMYFHWVFTAET
jgi:hypothetical protein